MWWSRAILCTCVILTAASVDDPPDSRVVRTFHGPVRGYRAPEGGLFVFYGIPYAAAPTGPDKFKAPLPTSMWLDTFEAVDKGIICPQLDSPWVETKNVQEDCLIANVYVPDTVATNLSVIVYVHGGAYQAGFGDLITPKNLVLSKQVIVVNFNYRLGVHGFLCLGTPDAPGNAGMKDQVAALRWVKRNIVSFEGNPDDITIAGYCAGSHSVDLLMIADSAKGLFNKVIAESGASIGPAFVVDPVKNAKDFALAMNFSDVHDIYALENYYKNSPLELLTKGSLVDRPDSTLPFAPCLERGTDEEVFIKEDPIGILKRGQFKVVPMLYGFSNMEGMLRLVTFASWKDKMNEKFSDFLPGDLQFQNTEQKEEAAKEVKDFYFGTKSIGDDTILEWIDYFGDILFAYPMLRVLKMYAEAGHDQVYLYKYNYVDEYSPVVPNTNIRGASHCAQTSAVLDGKSLFDLDESDISDDLKKMKSTMRDIWVYFMKTGSPVPANSDLPTWPAANADGSPYMSLSLPPQLRQEDPLSGRARFWDNLYAQYYRAPQPPPIPPPRHTEL